MQKSHFSNDIDHYRFLQWLKWKIELRRGERLFTVIEEVSGAVEISQLMPWIKRQHFEKTYLSASTEQTHHSAEEKPLILRLWQRADPFYIILYIRTVEIDKLIAIIQPQTGERARRRKFIFPPEGAGCCHNTPLILKRERPRVSLCARVS